MTYVYVSTEVDVDAAEMQVACDGTINNEPWLALFNTYVCLLLLGGYQKWLGQSDAAGNISNEVADDILLDTIAPSTPMWKTFNAS